MSVVEDQLDLQAHEALKSLESWRKQHYSWRLSSAFGYGYKSDFSGVSLAETQQRARYECGGTIDEEAFTAIAYGHYAGGADATGAKLNWLDAIWSGSSTTTPAV